MGELVYDDEGNAVGVRVNPPEAASRIAELKAKLATAVGALERARGDMEGWANYADTYFHEKHNLAGDLAAIDQALASIQERT